MFHDDLDDSWSYQEIFQKGFEQGLQKGFEQRLEQEKLLTSRSFLKRLAEKRFPPLLPLVQKKITLLKTVDELNSTFDKLFQAQTIKEAKQVLEEIEPQPHTAKNRHKQG
jgi:hypothetical protein